MSVLSGLTRDLEAGAVGPEALAETARALAGELDDPAVSAAGKAACARALGEVLARLREWAPPVVAEDAVDRLGKGRAKRQADVRRSTGRRRSSS